ncbi:MAG: twin-arginine translocase subunit TatB [Alphaproteobacteria bacterium]|nr:twin-arginine translocase subunit TatB [Alphaproteobacteria bacterium]
MFDIGATELLLIGIVAIIVVGPKELPKMLRAFGQFVAKMRGMAREFQSMFEEAARDTGMDDITKSVSDVKNFSVTDTVSQALDPVKDEFDEMKLDLDTEAPAPAPTEKPKADPIDEANKTAAKTAAKVRAKSSKPTARKKKTPKKTAAAKPAAKTAG